jgi:hypothetical protein
MIGNSLAQFPIEVKYLCRISGGKNAGKIHEDERKFF